MEQDPDPLPPAEGDSVEPAADDRGELDAPAVPFLDRRGHPRRRAESLLVRLIATCGVVGIAVAIAAVMGSQDVAAWVIGLVVAVTCVVLSALLWSSRTL